jgi:hypothetical protein
MRKLTDVKIRAQADAYFDYLQKYTPVSDELRAAELVRDKACKLISPFAIACEAARKNMGDDRCRCSSFDGYLIARRTYEEADSIWHNLAIQRSQLIKKQISEFVAVLRGKQLLLRRLKQKRRGQI